MHRTAVCIDILTKEIDLAHALLSKICHFGNNVVKWSRNLFATRVRYNTEAAVLTATLHNRHKSCWPVGARFWQAVKFLYLRE